MKCRSIIPFLAGLLILSSCDSDDKFANPVPIEISSRVNVKARVGDVLYENIDASVVVRGFNADGEMKWSDEFEYEGIDSANVLRIPSGYQYYVMTATTWGSEDSQTISGLQLYDERSDGPSPTTYVFAPEVSPPRLKSVIKSIETDIEGEVSLIPYAKEEFIWSDNRLIEIRDSEYDKATESFVPARNYIFAYDNGHVSKISGFYAWADELFIETRYEYFPNGNVQRIVEQNHGSGVTTEANFTYDYNNQNVTVSYAHSNGQSFVYKVAMNWKNVTWDQITKGSSVCSEGSYSFDKAMNPYRHLGYTDMLMHNLSINNKLTEDIDYLACAFPDLTVESYQYSYNDDGFPLSKTIFYSNGRKGNEIYEY